jgi:RNA 2',3'-cyclic 3'-phosphodiesterase
MHTIRSFIAIPLSPEVQRNARRLLRDLREDKDGVKWVPEDNLHLTLKFLGDVVDREVPQVCQAIRRASATIEPFDLEFSSVGGFPTADRPRVIWSGISSGGEQLVELVTALETELAKLGFKPEPRDYRPHLTLGRVRSGSRSASTEVVERIARYQSRSLGAMPAEQVRLYASYLDTSGPTYHVMDTIWLGKQPDVDDDADDDELDDDSFD